MQNNTSKANSRKNMPSRTEIVTAISNDTCLRAKELQGGHVIKKGTRVVQYAGGYTNVFPFIDKNGKKVAVRCWCADIDRAQERCYHISEFLKKDSSQYFVEFRYVPDALLIAGSLHPVVIMDWVDGLTLKRYINEKGPSKELFLDLAKKFLEMVKYLHSKNIAHGDLQHGNIMVRPDGSLVLIDYDSMYINTLKGFSDVVKGLPGYQHPAREKTKYLSPKLDYFSELVIYLSFLIFAEKPNLWEEYTDTEDLLFSNEDFRHQNESRLFKEFQNSNNSTIKQLMKQLVQALEKNDIEKLYCLEEYLGATKSSVITTPKTTAVTTRIRVRKPDTKAILDKLDILMAVVEIHSVHPNIDYSSILNKFNH